MENLEKKTNLSRFRQKVKNFPSALKQRFQKFKKNEKAQIYLMMLPFATLFFLFTVLPVVMSMLLSFTDFNLLEFPKFIGFDNYKRLFLDDNVFLVAVKNTLIFAVITGPVSYIIAFLLAWLINELPHKVRVVFTLIFYAPSISGNAFLIWSLLFSSDSYGYFNAFLKNLGFINESIKWLENPDYILIILIIVQLWLSLGVAFLAFIAGLKNVDKSLYEAGAVDGIRNRWQELWFITLPSMKPQLMFGAVMQITAAFGVASVSIHLAGLPSVDNAGHTVVTHLIDYGQNKFEMGYASTIATILFIVMICSNKLVQKFLRKVGN